ncbi:hypothetical protein CUMW_241500 [Citrus unshiu]|uniref:Uncharacterized protein n=1 Tax=Citrus unshiu TaxID=55188 RepID=A0A2H5QLK2_CITUN|nr:hypothetical protein CUMW_241500 [Citrus unshiu]
MSLQVSAAPARETDDGSVKHQELKKEITRMLKAVNRPSHALELIDAIQLLECLTILKVRLMKSWERCTRLIKIVIFVIMKMMSSIITSFSFDCLDKMAIEFPLEEEKLKWQLLYMYYVTFARLSFNSME